MLALLLAVAVDTQPIRVAVSVEVDARLPTMTRRLLEDELHAFFRPIRVELLWRSLPEAEVQLTIAARPETPVITGCSRGRHDHRLAVTRLGSVAGTGRVVLWLEQVNQAASGNWDRPAPPLSEAPLGRALGRALAHELGHILLGERGHHRDGIMQRSLSPRDLTGARPGFSKEQQKRLAGLWR